MNEIENSFMARKHSKDSLKKSSKKSLDKIRKNLERSFSMGRLPELPKVPLTQEQIDSTRDPLDVLADKFANEKSIDKQD